MAELTALARAPSNIALIKYMGKKEGELNLPENPSLSLTLNHLCSFAEVTRGRSGAGGAHWVPELPRMESRPSALPLSVPMLSDSGVSRIIRHFEKVVRSMPEMLASFGLSAFSASDRNGSYILRTANTFPPSSGIASSASSFAAVTLAAAAAASENRAAFKQAFETNLLLRRSLADLSRQGSGSSCRSFEGPWVYWDHDHAASLETRMPELAHFVILVSCEPKKVSSSEAHRRVRSSPLWHGRVARVEERAREAVASLAEGDLKRLARITWSEAWEMHSLFHTCADPFSYWEAGTMDALQWLSTTQSEPVPPIVTLDAGPNVHVIVEARSAQSWKARLAQRFGDRIILQDRQGRGAELLG